MYYPFSFCDSIQNYSNELRFLDENISHSKIVVPNARSMPFSFSLSKSRKINACFNDKKHLFMLLAFLEERNRFTNHLLNLIPFDENYLNFALNHKRKIDPWNEAIIMYTLNYFSNRLCSFDGPFPEDLNFDSLRMHLKNLSMVNKRRFDVSFEEEPSGFKLYEFPSRDTEFEKGSVIVTNRIMNDCFLLFEDKLKIYGV